MRAVAPDHDALLQASRRVDWRFLLESPDLGRVACIGTHDRELIESLRLFSDTLTAAPHAPRAGEASLYDLVVLRNASSEDLKIASSLLRPGGWLYVEVDGTLRGRPGSPRSARGYARVLRRLGLVEIGTYLHWPDFHSCRAIVPLENPAAVRDALARGRRGARHGLWRRLAPALATLRLLAPIVPCASVVGQRAQASEDTVT